MRFAILGAALAALAFSPVQATVLTGRADERSSLSTAFGGPSLTPQFGNSFSFAVPDDGAFSISRVLFNVYPQDACGGQVLQCVFPHGGSANTTVTLTLSNLLWGGAPLADIVLTASFHATYTDGFPSFGDASLYWTGAPQVRNGFLDVTREVAGGVLDLRLFNGAGRFVGGLPDFSWQMLGEASFIPVPEPASLASLGVGLIALGLARRLRRG